MPSSLPTDRERTEVVVVGAGVAGASCAAALARAERPPLVLERARGVGGRCATRRVDGQPVDHGVCFLHGRDRELLATIRELAPERRIEGWPRRVVGAGNPCSPRAFAEGEQRLALVDGVSAFPKHLVRGLDVRPSHPVVALEVAPDGFEVRTERASFRARDVVLAMAPEQSARLLDTLAAPTPALRAARRLCDMLHSFPCATLILGFDAALGAELDWDMRYPDEGAAIQLVSHDSAKRVDPRYTVLVVQARPGWSARHLDEPPGEWGDALLREARALLPGLPERPLWRQQHRWSFARVDPGNSVALPMRVPGPRGGSISLVGDAFSPETGVEGAWRAGRRLARQLVDG